MSRRRLIWGFVGWAAAVGVAWLIAGLGTDTQSDWYLQLEKPAFQPPGWVFGPVWTLLYLSMIFAAWDVWRKNGWNDPRGRPALVAFLVQLVLNALWSILFFTLQMPAVAAVELVVLAIAVLVTVVLFARVSTLAAALMAPYLLWVIYASAINIAIWQLN